MTIFALKKYQTTTLDVLRSYHEAARIVGAAPAFDGMDKAGVREPRAYRSLEGLPTVPYVCLRLPTGGGKTLLSAHTVKVAADAYLEREFPIVLWLVPTNTIRAQTLETLKKPGNPNYEALSAAFRSSLRAGSRPACGEVPSYGKINKVATPDSGAFDYLQHSGWERSAIY